MPTARCLRCNQTRFWRNQRGQKKPTHCACGGKLAMRMRHPMDIKVEIERIARGEEEVQEKLRTGKYVNEADRLFWEGWLVRRQHYRHILEARLAKVEASL